MKYVQMDLFKDRDREKRGEIFLKASNSTKQAFYRIWIEELDEGYIVRKESGIFTKVLDRKNWWFRTYFEAEQYQQKLVNSKTNPERKSPISGECHSMRSDLME